MTRPLWERFESTRNSKANPFFYWEHWCPHDGGHRLFKARVLIELHGCPFGCGYPPELEDEQAREEIDKDYGRHGRG